MEESGQLHNPAALPSRKEPPVSIGEEAGCAPESVWTLWRREKSFTTGNRTRTVQPVARRYTDRATLNPSFMNSAGNSLFTFCPFLFP
jgi:hypothetical protein